MKKMSAIIMVIGTVGSDGLFCNEGTVLNGENHKVLLVDDRVLDTDGLLALFSNTRVEVVQHTIDKFILSE